jgi:transcriptional regulator with XRE-family HTH domain
VAKSFNQLASRTMTKADRQRARRRAKEILTELSLQELRESMGQRQKQLADSLGIKQPSLSKLEKQKDMQITTLRRLVQKMGGQLELIVRFPEGHVKLTQFDEPPGERVRHRAMR